MTEKLIRTDKDYISYLKLNDNPANSLSTEMMTAIQKELTDIDTNPVSYTHLTLPTNREV